MELPTVEVVEVHYWTVLIRDEFRPDGEEYPTRFTKSEAEAELQHLVDIKLATRKEKT